MQDITPRHKWNIIRYLGCPSPMLSAFQKKMLRKQLDERYCPRCGEYIYNPFNKRKIRHYHNPRLKHKFLPLLQERLLVHPRNQLVEWTRKFPHVMRLIISEDELLSYKNTRPQFIHRTPSARMWTIEEWNLLYPDVYIWKDDCIQRIRHPTHLDVLWLPDLVY